MLTALCECRRHDGWILESYSQVEVVMAIKVEISADKLEILESSIRAALVVAVSSSVYKANAVIEEVRDDVNVITTDPVLEAVRVTAHMRDVLYTSKAISKEDKEKIDGAMKE